MSVDIKELKTMEVGLLVKMASGLDVSKLVINKQVVDDFISEIDQQISAQAPLAFELAPQPPD